VLRPIRDRVKERIRQAKEAVAKDSAAGADIAEELLEHCLPLHELYEIFHGESGHQKTELFDEVAAACVDCVVAYQKETGDDPRFVEILRAALPLATDMDVRRRVLRNIEIGENNVRGEVLDPLYTLLKGVQESKESARVRLLRFNAELMPQLAAFVQQEGAGSELVNQICDAMAIVLREISLDAHNNEDDVPTSVDAIRIATRLAVSADLRKRTQDDCAVLEKNLVHHQAALVDLLIREDRVRIDAQNVRYNRQRLSIEEIHAIRFGILIRYRNGVQNSSSYFLEFLSERGYIQIECKRFLRSDAQARKDYEEILKGVLYFVAPKVAGKAAARIAAGQPCHMGGAKLTREGVSMSTGMLMWAKEHLVPWSDVRFSMSQGMLHISAGSNPKISATASLRETSNAVLFEPIARILASELNA
jgi:hypothetical protein